MPISKIKIPTLHALCFHRLPLSFAEGQHLVLGFFYCDLIVVCFVDIVTVIFKVKGVHDQRSCFFDG